MGSHVSGSISSTSIYISTTSRQGKNTMDGNGLKEVMSSVNSMCNGNAPTSNSNTRKTGRQSISTLTLEEMYALIAQHKKHSVFLKEI